MELLPLLIGLVIGFYLGRRARRRAWGSTAAQEPAVALLEGSRARSTTLMGLRPALPLLSSVAAFWRLGPIKAGHPLPCCSFREGDQCSPERAAKPVHCPRQFRKVSGSFSGTSTNVLVPLCCGKRGSALMFEGKHGQGRATVETSGPPLCEVDEEVLLRVFEPHR